MAEPIPVELRERVVRAYEAGEGGYGAIALRFGVSLMSVRRWVERCRRTGHVTPAKKRGGAYSTVDLGELEAIVEHLGDANADEITAAYNRGRRGRDRRHVSSIKRALHRAGYVVKKNASGRSSNSVRTSWRSVPRS